MKIYNPIILLKSIVSILLVVGLFSCTDEEIASNKANVEEGIMTDLSLSFTSATPTVQSRGALEIQQEYKVYNLYVLVFNNRTGVKEYGHLFQLNAADDADKLLDVHEKINTNDATTSGKVKMKLPSGEKRIYAVANVPAGDSHAELRDNLEDVQSIEDLENNVVISQKVITRPNDKLVMSGWLQNGTQKEGDPDGYCVIDRNGTNSLSTIQLVRVDARVTFNVTLDTKKPIAERGETILERKFTPLKYAVKSVPNKAYLYGKDDNALVKDAEYFSTNEANFEVIENNVSSFTFYMMENKQAVAGLSIYEEREKQNKNSNGSNGNYTYAPLTATYIEVTGYYFEKYQDNRGVMKERHADVKYTIHLGYVGGDANDFRCKRNYAYIYNVYVQSVNKIRLEVTSYNNGEGTTDEAQPGAEGAIIESDKYFQLDSHYDHILVTFRKQDVQGKYGFRVKTPFDEGYYYVSGEANSVPAGALPLSEAKDYKWVKFMQNEKSKNGKYKSNEYRAFNPSKFITVDQLLIDLHTNNSVYDSDGNAVYTMYIDEYHYPCDPREGHYGEYTNTGKLTVEASNKEGTTFWKEFVNQPNREMHILCNTQFSEDKESSLTTSAIMISQRSIKTFYNEKAAGLKTAWGLETINETGKIAPGDKNPWSTNNSSKNGRWNFFNQTSNFSSSSWSSYISPTVKQDKDGIHDYMSVTGNDKLIYSCLQRNRDENGNGKIEADEVKWYPAAIDQYSSIWVGAPALPTETYLYTNQVATEQGYRRYLSSDGKELYAEEGASIGSFNFGYANSIWGTDDKDKGRIEKKYDYRCLRDLGMSNSKPKNVNDMPQHFVTSTNDGDGYILELTYMNEDALRTEENYMRGEITAHDEKSDLNRPYVKFEFKEKLVYNKNNTRWEWNSLNTLINKDPSNSPCAQFNKGLSADEPKWRLPNARELSLMTSNYNIWKDEQYVQSRTGSSLPIKKQNNNGYSGGYSDNKPFMTLAANSFKGPVRCVRDVR